MKRDYSKIRIKSTKGALTELYINGNLVRGVRRLTFKKKAGGVPTLTVDISALDIEIDSPAVLKQDGYEDMTIDFVKGRQVFKQ